MESTKTIKNYSQSNICIVVIFIFVNNDYRLLFKREYFVHITRSRMHGVILIFIFLTSSLYNHQYSEIIGGRDGTFVNDILQFRPSFINT